MIERRDPLWTKVKDVLHLTRFINVSNLKREINDLDNIDFIPSNVQSSHQEALLYVFEDNVTVIKMISKGRSLTLRHISRIHRVTLDWLFDRINLDLKIHIKYIDIKDQLADNLTKGNFTRDEWNHFLRLFNSSFFEFYKVFWSDVEKNGTWFRWRKSHSNDEFVLAMQRKNSCHAHLYCISSVAYVDSSSYSE